MNNIKLLDCTLREAPIADMQWGELSIKRTINGLTEAGVEIIECGFLRDGEHIKGSTIYNTPKQVQQIDKNKTSLTLYALLVDYGRYDVSQLPYNDDNIISMIRLCFKKSEAAEVLKEAKLIQDKGYKVGIQHVNTVAYSEREIVEFIKGVNELHPYSYSIVDTFGSLYFDDVKKLCDMSDRFLDKDIILGLHTHNNLMLANSNAEFFVQQMKNKRSIIVDASLYGCGRGAGNANTELLAEYLNKKEGSKYDIDQMTDLIDSVVIATKKKATWGYSIPYFISGLNNAHSFNVNYLTKRHNIKSKDLRNIIELLGDEDKPRYDYELLDKLYVGYFNCPIDDKALYDRIRKSIEGRSILLVAPGKSINTQRDNILKFIKKYNPVIFGVNNYISGITCDYIFYSGIRRYEMIPFQEEFKSGNIVVIKTSNIRKCLYDNEIIVDYGKLIKFGWTYFDSSIILLLRLLSKCGARHINLAGLDGYKTRGETFYNPELETSLTDDERQQALEENASMIEDYLLTDDVDLCFVTDSEYYGKLQKQNVCRWHSDI